MYKWTHTPLHVNTDAVSKWGMNHPVYTKQRDVFSLRDDASTSEERQRKEWNEADLETETAQPLM